MELKKEAKQELMSRLRDIDLQLMKGEMWRDRGQNPYGRLGEKDRFKMKELRKEKARIKTRLKQLEK